ncbi:hypothetical protein BDP81DRAFT_417028 [Colletotrichum phormii]|uniref:Uncharacterized protein n=1 Tax=Colletotrichum phormii TaxID=359342 RepID=A0AAJ0EMZ9_9PEZI|nr:uncharacterized protein BDP81DRAFT_417028 [Colletotrichum phormii]KAK1654978.1 hypothetical protein BDP81DRAFT_417028 [Colletotrichum phormii]
MHATFLRLHALILTPVRGEPWNRESGVAGRAKAALELSPNPPAPRTGSRVLPDPDTK